jgi:hypothetical protein
MTLGLAAEVLAASALVAMVVTGRVSVAGILAVAFAFGVVRAIASPAQRAMMPNLVPTSVFSSAVAWSGFAWQAATIGGPALGGLLYILGPAVAYGTTAAALVAAMVAIAGISPQPPRGREERPSLASVLAGLSLIFRHELLLGAISLDLFAVLFSGAVQLLPVYAKDILHLGSEGLGVLRSAPGLGAVVIAVVLTQWPLRRHVGRWLFLAIGIFGLAAIAFGLSRDVAVSYLALMVLGAADNISVYIRGSLVPLATPDALRGRVVAVEAVFIGASNELGAFVAGTGAALLGPVAAVLAGGSLTLAVAVLWSGMFPSLRRIDRMESVLAEPEIELADDRVAERA